MKKGRGPEGPGLGLDEGAAGEERGGGELERE